MKLVARIIGLIAIIICFFSLSVHIIIVDFKIEWLGDKDMAKVNK